MRLLGVLTALVVTVCAWPAAAAGDPDAACRQQWADLHQLHAENGNPRGPVPALAQRWREHDRTAEEYAEGASAADCGSTLEELAAAWAALESFQYDLDAFDPRADLRRAERDRRHALAVGRRLSPEVRRALRVVRAQTPGAVEDLAPALAGAADVDPGDRDAVRAFVRDARAVKRDSRPVQRMRPAYRVIASAELDEE